MKFPSDKVVGQLRELHKEKRESYREWERAEETDSEYPSPINREMAVRAKVRWHNAAEAYERALLRAAKSDTRKAKFLKRYIEHHP